MARKSYKTLYLAKCKEATAAEVRLTTALHRLNELNAVLIPFGEDVLISAPKGNGRLYLGPLDFIAARAAIESQCGLPAFQQGYQGWQQYSWRGRPIIRVVD